MSNDAFNRNRTKEARLGHLITEPGEQNQRDAVHIAVVPVEATTRLARGQEIGVTADGKKSVVGSGVLVGIVDPFLVLDVMPGETFWLFLFQGSVNTLRHEWTHDAFPSAHPNVVTKVQDTAKVIAEARMKKFAEEECGWTISHLLDEAESAIEYGEGIHMGQTEGVVAYPEFMEDFAVLTGKDVTGKSEPYFTCSC